MEEIHKALARHGLRLRKTTFDKVSIGDFVYDFASSQFFLVDSLQRTYSTSLSTPALILIQGGKCETGPYPTNCEIGIVEAIPAADSEQRLETSKELLAEANLAIIANAEKILLADGNRAPCWSVLTSAGLLSWHGDNFYLRDEKGHVERLKDCSASVIANAVAGIPFLLQNAKTASADDHCNVETLRSEINAVERMLVEDGCVTPVSVGEIAWRRYNGQWGLFWSDAPFAAPFAVVTDTRPKLLVRCATWIPELIEKARATRPRPVADIIRAIRIARGVPT